MRVDSSLSMGSAYSCTNCGSHLLNIGQSVEIVVTFSGAGQSRGTKTAQLHIEHCTECIHTVIQEDYAFTGMIIEYPNLIGSYGASMQTFLNEPVTSFARIINNGSQNLTITDMSLTGNDPSLFQFGLESNTVPGGGYVDIPLQYLASAQGAHSAQIHVTYTYEGINYQYDLPLQGQTRLRPDVSGSSINFGIRYYNQSTNAAAQLVNNGALDLTINSITLTGANPGQFQISWNTGTLPSGQTRNIDVTYMANAVGSHSASIDVAFTYDGLSYSIQLPLSGETIPVPAAQLWLDDVLIDEESQPVSWVDNNTLRPALTLNIDHPYAAPCVPGGPPGCYADQPSTYILKRGASYAIISDFGGSKDGLLLKKRQKILNDYRAIDGLQDMSREVRTEALNIVGQTWMHQTTMSDNLLSQLANVIHVRHHRFGIMAQEKGYYVDVKTQMYSYTSRNNTADDEYKCFKSGGFLNSAMEHGVLEQLQGIDRPAASTIKLITIANTNGSKIFFANGSDFPAIRPQLSGYNEEDLNDIAVRVKPIAEGGDGAVYILPANGLIPLGQWQGKGYVKFTSSEIGMIIGGDYYGGYAGYEGDLEVDPVYNEYFPDLLPPAEISNPVSMEPVDMATGAYTFEHEDLSLGAAEPMGLHFRRYYNSDNNTQESSLGYGWSHSYDIYLNVHSDVKSGLAMRQPIDAAALLVSSIVTLDLMSMSQEQPGIKEWMTAVLTNKWAMDQLFENSVSVHLQNKVLNYIKLPDGISYNPPPGETTQLVKENGLYRIEERFGTKIYLDSNNRISQLTDVDGNAMTFTYDSSGLKTARDAFGRMLTLQYSGDKITSVSDSAGRTVNYSYGADNLTAYSDPEGNGWGYGYEDSNNPHRMTKLTNPMIVNTAINTYDSLGRVKTQSVPRQGSNNTRVNYNFYFSRFKNMEENPDGNTIGYYFDDKGRQIARENELGHKSTTEYDGQNHVIRYTDPKSKVTQFLYDDSSHNLKKITNALNEETKYSYDSLFRLRDTVAPLFNGAHIEYDAEHHPVLAKFGVRYDATLSPVDSGIFQTSASYYANGQTETTSDGRGAVTTLTYDDYGNPNTIRVGSHRFVNYTYYYEIGKIGYLTDQVGSITSFDYDKRGLLESKTDPMGKTTSFTYWSTGNPFSRTDRNNHTIYYSYSLTDKLESITYPDFSTVRLTYNQHDDLSGVQDSVGNISYIYDAAHRLISMTNPYNSAVSYAYDANGNLTELTYPGNKKVVYTYDALNRLNSVMLDWVTPKQTANYYYDAAGRLDYAVNFNGTIMDYDYDNANRLTTLVNKKSDAATLASYSFTLDGNGNRTQIVQDEPLTLSPATDASYAYNAKKNRLLTAGAFSFGYDDEGQLQTGYSSTYSFDYEHRLTGIGSNIQFSYDLVGNRLQAERNGVTTRYIYDAGGNLLAEADGSNNITRYYIHGLGLLAMVTPGNQTYCYHFNAVGSTIAMTDLSQSLVNKYAYDAFGTVTSYAENIPQPFKFVGQFGVMTEPNGFYYMRARYYDPNVGRFISEDPIGFEGGDINLYAYVGNQPVNYNDPNGQFCPWCAVVGGVTGAIGGYTAGTISGDGSTIAALGGGLVGGLAGAIVGLSGVGTFGGGAIGEAAGSIVGGFIGGGVGSIASRQIDNKEFSLSATGVGALAGGLSATIASPVVWGAAALGASEFATSLAGGTMGIMGDTLIGTGAAIHNSWK
ncbi:MAG: choice-of-anchor D domain-containing protein [Nitrospirae bacterium]|nr:choice-of-anchor D domain-containing protein [Nitrospirota bacterium]